MNIKEFLERHIDGYLICDVKRMAEAGVYENGYGACGYPMLITLLSGIELIGKLIFTEQWNEDNLNFGKAGASFEDGWRFLFSGDVRYSSEKVRRIFKNLIRNGLAHMFLTKPCIGIVKNIPESHLRFRDGIFYVDVIEFFKDFHLAYLSKKSMLISKECQNRLDEILNILEQESLKLMGGKFSKLYFARSVPLEGIPMSATPISGTSLMGKNFWEMFSRRRKGDDV